MSRSARIGTSFGRIRPSPPRRPRSSRSRCCSRGDAASREKGPSIYDRVAKVEKARRALSRIPRKVRPRRRCRRALLLSASPLLVRESDVRAESTTSVVRSRRRTFPPARPTTRATRTAAAASRSHQLPRRRSSAPRAFRSADRVGPARRRRRPQHVKSRPDGSYRGRRRLTGKAHRSALERRPPFFDRHDSAESALVGGWRSRLAHQEQLPTDLRCRRFDARPSRASFIAPQSSGSARSLQQTRSPLTTTSKIIVRFAIEHRARRMLTPRT